MHTVSFCLRLLLLRIIIVHIQLSLDLHHHYRTSTTNNLSAPITTYLGETPALRID